MKKLLTAAAIATLALAAAPAQAQWQGGAAQQAAASYCASRAAGNDNDKAERDARWVLTNSLNGGFADMMSTALTSGRQMMQTTGYLARQMCPEFFGGVPSSSTVSTADYQNLPAVDPSTCKAFPSLAETMWKGRCG
jgi:hypothetical protein